MLARVSHDNGTTWSAIATIAEEDGVTGGYVAPMVDTQRGAVLVLYNRKFTETWLVASRDDGMHSLGLGLILPHPPTHLFSFPGVAPPHNMGGVGVRGVGGWVDVGG